MRTSRISDGCRNVSTWTPFADGDEYDVARIGFRFLAGWGPADPDRCATDIPVPARIARYCGRKAYRSGGAGTRRTLTRRVSVGCQKLTVRPVGAANMVELSRR